jgi:hypothetical protein
MLAAADSAANAAATAAIAKSVFILGVFYRLLGKHQP